MSDVIDRAHQAAWTAWATDEGTVLQIDVYTSAALVELLERLLSDQRRGDYFPGARSVVIIPEAELRRLLEEVQDG